MGTKSEGNTQFMFTNSKQYPHERLNLSCEKKLNTKLEKRIFEAEKEYPAEKIKSLPNFFFFVIFHTKVVTGSADQR